MLDLQKLKKMAEMQQASESDELPEQSDISSYVPSKDRQNENIFSEMHDEIYVPIDDEPEQFPEDGYDTTENYEILESLEDIIIRSFPDEKAYNIELERLIPFRDPIFSVDGDISALKSSITRMGITEPLLVRSAGNGEYEILSGNLRRKAAEILLWSKVPCRIADNEKLTDEDANRIVVESNRERFPTLKLSEKIRVSAVLGNRAVNELSLTPELVQKYAQLNRLEHDFLIMLDSGNLSGAIAEKLSAIERESQKLILNVLNQHPEMKLTGTNVNELCAAGSLTESSIAKILKPKPPIKIAVPAEIVNEFMDGKSPEELSKIVTKAICRYFEEKTNGTN